MGIACSKKRSQKSFPAEFSQQVAHLQKIREGTLEIVKQLDKFNPDKEANGGKNNKQKKPPPPKVLDQVANTCMKYTALLAGHSYGQQMGRLASACKKMSKHLTDTEEQIDQKAITPMRQWAGDGYENLMKELTKCQKLKEDVNRMVKQAAAKPELKEKLEAVKKAYESQRRFCAKEVKDTERVFSNHMQYLTEFDELQWKESSYACIQLYGALMNNTLKTAKSGRQQPGETAMPADNDEK